MNRHNDRYSPQLPSTIFALPHGYDSPIKIITHIYIYIYTYIYYRDLYISDVSDHSTIGSLVSLTVSIEKFFGIFLCVLLNKKKKKRKFVKMIVYVPGRMPSHVGPYGAARYPGTLLGTAVPAYYSSSSVYSTSGNNNPSTPVSYYTANLNLQQQPLDLPVWPRRMPAEDELGTSPTSGLGSLGASPGGGLASGGPPSPAHSDSDASNSSLELGSVRRGENAQLKCR